MRCEAGVPASQDARRKLWAIHPAGVRHGSRNGPGTAQETDGLNGDTGSVLFPAHYGAQRVAATLHFSEHRLRERGRSGTGLPVQAECHCHSSDNEVMRVKHEFFGCSFVKVLVTLLGIL